jgi:NADH-quinone oxidoreductase subunit J
MVSFIVLAAFLIAFSLLVIILKNPVHSALALVAALFTIAVLFLTLHAPMVAMFQILVYAGAIMVLFLFVIMLLNPGTVEKRTPFWWGAGSVATALLALELMVVFSPFHLGGEKLGVNQVSDGFGSPKMLAQSLFNDFVLPFEVASVLLLVAIIGAVVLAKREE